MKLGKDSPIEGHSFLPNKKVRTLVCLSLRKCKQCQDRNDECVKSFRGLSIKASTDVANETGDRLLNSEKDNVECSFEQLTLFANIVNQVRERS